MTSKGFRYDGERKLSLSSEPTGCGSAGNHKSQLTALTRRNLERVAELQEMLYAGRREGLVIAMQARNAAGKDSIIRHVFSGLNPAGVTVHSFKAPNATELEHDYLWRIQQAMPPRGSIGVFNRSQYEDVIVTRVHGLEKTCGLPERCMTDDFYRRRYRQLRDWELYLYENGYRMVKLFLNVGKEAQRERFLDRLERDDKHWKLFATDMKERVLWDEYTRAYEDAINATATREAPWYVIPADQKWFTCYVVSQILADTLETMDPHWPPLNKADSAQVPAILSMLEQEGGRPERKE